MGEFTFTWKIENFSLGVVKKGNYVASPEFTAHSLEKSTWFLQVYPYGEKDAVEVIPFYLNRAKNDEGPTTILVNFTMWLVMLDGNKHCIKEFAGHSFKHFDRVRCFESRTLDDLVKDKKILFRDTLTVQCKIVICNCPKSARSNETVHNLLGFVYGKKSVAELPSELFEIADDVLWEMKEQLGPYPNYITTRTRVCIEKRTLKWKVHRFSELEGDKDLIPLISVSKLTPTLLLKLQLDEEPDPSFRIKIKKMKEVTSPVVVCCKIKILDNRGKSSDLKQKSYCFDLKTDQFYQLPPLAKKSEILQEEFYLKNDTLTLLLEFKFSNAMLSSNIEETIYFGTENPNEFSDCDIVETLHVVPDRQFCDFTLIVENKSFPVHKSILAAKSPKFKKMFESRSEDEDTLEITDLSVENISPFLGYVYDDVLYLGTQNYWARSAIKLYRAAVKYECVELKNNCLDVLENSLSVANFSKILRFAVKSNEEGLTKAAVDFFVFYMVDILRSNEWEGFIKKRSMLAAETLASVVLKVFE